MSFGPKKSREQLNQENVRIQKLPNGDQLLNISAICTVFDISYSAFKKRQQRGWVSLGKEKLTPHEMRWQRPGEPEGCRTEEGFLKSEVATAMKKPGDKVNRYEVDGQIRINRDGAAEELGVHERTLANWEDDGLLTAEISVNPSTGYREKTYPLPRIQNLVTSRKQDKKKRKSRPRTLKRDKNKYLRHDLTRKSLGVGESTLNKYRNQGCRYLGGDKIDYFSELGCMWYLDRHVSVIKKAMARLSKGHFHFPANAPDDLYLTLGAIARDETLKIIHRGTIRRLVADDLVRVKTLAGVNVRGRDKLIHSAHDLKEYLNNRGDKWNGIWDLDDGRAFTICAGAKHIGVTPSFLKKRLKNPRPYLDTPLVVIQRKPPVRGKYNKQIGSLSAAELERLKAAVENAYAQDEYRKSGWLSAGNILVNLDLADDIEKKIKLGSWLRKQREAEWTDGQEYRHCWSRIDRGGTIIYRCVYRYKPETLKQALDGWLAEQGGSLSGDAELMRSANHQTPEQATLESPKTKPLYEMSVDEFKEMQEEIAKPLLEVGSQIVAALLAILNVTPSNLENGKTLGTTTTTASTQSLVEAPPCEDKPRWQNRQLWFRDQVIKEYTKQAPRQEPILDAFEANGWKRQIDSPFTKDSEVPLARIIH